MRFTKILLITVGLACAGLSLSAQADDTKKTGNGKGKTTNAPKGMKARHLNGEATMKTKDQKNVDFEAADIGGERKAPLGTLINQNKADKNYDFVKIRMGWHPEMVQSAASLEQGASK